MTDGFNDARALRVTEILKDYHDLQRKIAQYDASSTQATANEIGFVVLRQCHAEARALLSSQYSVELLHPPTGQGEAQKRQLQRVIIDASARRFRAQKIYLRATAAMKWINRRRQICPNGQKPTNGQHNQLTQAENVMRTITVMADCNVEQDIANATDQRIVNALRAKDQQAGFWLQDDPGLPAVLAWIKSHP